MDPVSQAYMRKMYLIHNWITMSLLIDFVNRHFWMSQFNWMKELNIEQLDLMGPKQKQACIFSPADLWMAAMPSRDWDKKLFGYLMNCSCFYLATSIAKILKSASKARDLIIDELRAEEWFELLPFTSLAVLRSTPVPDVKSVEKLARRTMIKIAAEVYPKPDIAIAAGNPKELERLLDQEKALGATFKDACTKLYDVFGEINLEIEKQLRAIETTALKFQGQTEIAALDDEYDMDQALREFAGDHIVDGITANLSHERANIFYGRFMWRLSNDTRKSLAETMSAFEGARTRIMANKAMPV